MEISSTQQILYPGERLKKNPEYNFLCIVLSEAGSAVAELRSRHRGRVSDL